MEIISQLTQWVRVTHICVGNITIIGSDNGLSPARRQAINWSNDGIWLIGQLRINFSEILIEIHTFSFKKIHLKMSSGNWLSLCLGLNVLRYDMGCPSHCNDACGVMLYCTVLKHQLLSQGYQAYHVNGILYGDYHDLMFVVIRYRILY